MENINLAKRVKELRNKKGFSQEKLADESSLSLRTIQRIENNETVPRGDTLKRLAIALDSSPDDIVDWKTQEDKGYLTLMSLSALGFLFFPILGIVIPLIFWILKKDKVRDVNELGKSILNFEITWCILFFSYFIFLFSGTLEAIMNIVGSGHQGVNILKIYIPVIILYTYNFIIIVMNAMRISKNKNTLFFPALKIFR